MQLFYDIAGMFAGIPGISIFIWNSHSPASMRGPAEAAPANENDNVATITQSEVRIFKLLVVTHEAPHVAAE